MLGSVHTLALIGCTGITDVSALGDVHTLNLNCCTAITDVTALGGVHTLNLSGCPGVSDVLALVGVHTLNLSGCAGVIDASALGGVRTLIRVIGTTASVHACLCVLVPASCSRSRTRLFVPDARSWRALPDHVAS